MIPRVLLALADLARLALEVVYQAGRVARRLGGGRGAR